MHQWVWPPPSMPEGAVASVHPDVGAAATLASTVGTSGYEDGLLGPGAGTAPQSWYAGIYVLTSAPRSVLLKPAIIRNAVHRGHAGRACADKRLLIDLARAEENLQLRGDRRRIRWVARLVCEVQGVVDRSQLQEGSDARGRAPPRLPRHRTGTVEGQNCLGRQHAI